MKLESNLFSIFDTKNHLFMIFYKQFKTNSEYKELKHPDFIDGAAYACITLCFEFWRLKSLPNSILLPYLLYLSETSKALNMKALMTNLIYVLRRYACTLI